MKRLAYKQAGDTIVEVLLAIAVVGAVLGSSFAVVGRMLNNAQQAKEHEEALKLLEGQVEMLKVKATTDPTIFTQGSPFCLKSVDLPVTHGCTDPIGRYHLSITGVNILNGSTFSANANWDGPTGGHEQVNLIYRLYHP